jgi:4'-phosphopantetheinyl transferase
LRWMRSRHSRKSRDERSGVTVGVHAGVVQADGAAADIWIAWVERQADAVADLTATVLSPAERARSAAYRNDDAAARYVITRSLVRSVLGERLSIAPADVDIRVTDLGKPVVSGALHFNVSHSGDLIALAVSADRAVGVDIERRREVKRAGALIARWLTEPERREVSLLHAGGVDESDAFLRIWSAKEARLKALGVGISGATSADVSRLPTVALDDVLAKAGTRGYFGAVAFA